MYDLELNELIELQAKMDERIKELKALYSEPIDQVFAKIENIPIAGLILSKEAKLKEIFQHHEIETIGDLLGNYTQESFVKVSVGLGFKTVECLNHVIISKYKTISWKKKKKKQAFRTIFF